MFPEPSAMREREVRNDKNRFTSELGRPPLWNGEGASVVLGQGRSLNCGGEREKERESERERN